MNLVRSLLNVLILIFFSFIVRDVEIVVFFSEDFFLTKSSRS